MLHFSKGQSSLFDLLRNCNPPPSPIYQEVLNKNKMSIKEAGREPKTHLFRKIQVHNAGPQVDPDGTYTCCSVSPVSDIQCFSQFCFLVFRKLLNPCPPPLYFDGSRGSYNFAIFGHICKLKEDTWFTVMLKSLHTPWHFPIECHSKQVAQSISIGVGVCKLTQLFGLPLK